MNRDTKLTLFLFIGLPVLTLIITVVVVNFGGALEDAPSGKRPSAESANTPR